MTFRAGEARGGMPPLAGEWVAREVPPAVAGWSDQQLVTLAAVVDAVVPGPDAAGRAGAIAAAVSGIAPAAPCDPWGRVRRGPDGSGVAGLAVADASLAPSAPGDDPAVTVMALAARVARAVLAER